MCKLLVVDFFGELGHFSITWCFGLNISLCSLSGLCLSHWFLWVWLSFLSKSQSQSCNILVYRNCKLHIVFWIYNQCASFVISFAMSLLSTNYIFLPLLVVARSSQCQCQWKWSRHFLPSDHTTSSPAWTTEPGFMHSARMVNTPRDVSTPLVSFMYQSWLELFLLCEG